MRIFGGGALSNQPQYYMSRNRKILKDKGNVPDIPAIIPFLSHLRKIGVQLCVAVILLR